MLKKIIMLLALPLSLSACNTGVLNGSDQVVQIVTTPVQYAHCIIENKRSSWNVNNTPSYLSIWRSPGPMLVSCKTVDGWEGSTLVRPGVDGRASFEAFPTANLGINDTGFKLIDVEADSIWQYPGRIEVIMHKVTPPPPPDAHVFPPGRMRGYGHSSRPHHLPPLVK